MKILKPGKTETRKFVCPVCGCIFVGAKNEVELDDEIGYEFIRCPCCNKFRYWKSGELYEEPTQDTLERLNDIIREWNWWNDGTCGFAQYLIANGVTFKE